MNVYESKTKQPENFISNRKRDAKKQRRPRMYLQTVEPVYVRDDVKWVSKAMQKKNLLKPTKFYSILDVFFFRCSVLFIRIYIY